MSKVHGGMKCVKYLLFIFNFIFWLVGSLVLSVGLWLRFNQDITSLLSIESTPKTFFMGVYILMGAGGLMMLVGFFGCCGAVRESQCLLGSFFACLLIIFAAEVAAGVFGFMNKEKIIKEIQGFYENSTKTNANSTVALIYKKVLKCCGTAKSDPSLCSETKKDCEQAISEFFNDKLYIVGYVGIGIAGAMIVGMIFSMVLCCAIRNSRDII